MIASTGFVLAMVFSSGKVLALDTATVYKTKADCEIVSNYINDQRKKAAEAKNKTYQYNKPLICTDKYDTAL